MTSSVAQIVTSRTLAAVSNIAASVDNTLPFGLPLVSCLRSARSRSSYASRSYAVKPEDRVGRGSLSLLLGPTTLCEYALPEPFFAGSAHYGKDEMRRHRPRQQTGKVQPVRNMSLQLCAALTSAKCLAQQVDTLVMFGWPVHWTADSASFFLPSSEGYTPSRHKKCDTKNCAVWTCTREEGMQWSAPHWNLLYHTGAVPTSTELRFHFDSSHAHAEVVDFIYNPRLDHILSGDSLLSSFGNNDLVHGPDYYVEKPTPPVVMSIVRQDVVDIPRWLMDTGSGLDIVKRASIAGCEVYVSENDGITLMTANGEVDANEEITLYVSGIGTNISPTVLDDAPDLQSLGKRCVEDGFGSHIR
jgi:hypothetical protein